LDASYISFAIKLINYLALKAQSLAWRFLCKSIMHMLIILLGIEKTKTKLEIKMRKMEMNEPHSKHTYYISSWPSVDHQWVTDDCFDIDVFVVFVVVLVV